MVLNNSNLEVTGVEWSQQNIREHLNGFNLDSPNRNFTSNGFTLNLKGWIVGKNLRAVAMEVLWDKELAERVAELLVQKVPVELPRLDVSDKHPHWENAVISGFQSRIDTLAMPTLFALALQAVLADGTRVYLGKIKFKTLHYYRHFYFVNHKCGFVYCSIPKNACTLLRSFTMEYSGDNQFRAEKDNIHSYLQKNKTAIRLSDMSVLEEYFKFVVFRDPFKRLVSGYLDKIVRNKSESRADFAQQAIAWVYQQQGLERTMSRE